MGRGGRKRPLCSVHPGSHVNHGPRETGRRIGHSFTNTLIGARTHTHTGTHSGTGVRGTDARQPCALCVGAADNMQLRAVSSTLPCSHSVFRALSREMPSAFSLVCVAKRRHRIRTPATKSYTTRNLSSRRLLVVSSSRHLVVSRVWNTTDSGMTIVTTLHRVTDYRFSFLFFSFLFFSPCCSTFDSAGNESRCFRVHSPSNRKSTLGATSCVNWPRLPNAERVKRKKVAAAVPCHCHLTSVANS